MFNHLIHDENMNFNHDKTILGKAINSENQNLFDSGQTRRVLITKF